jgi:hypothetical protein
MGEYVFSTLLGSMRRCTKREGYFFYPYINRSGKPEENYCHEACLSKFFLLGDVLDSAETVEGRCDFCAKSIIHDQDIVEVTRVLYEDINEFIPVKNDYDILVRAYICWPCMVKYVGEGSTKKVAYQTNITPAFH